MKDFVVAQTNNKVLQLTHEVQNYKVVHHLESEQQSIKQRARMCAQLNPAHYNHMVVVYVIALNKTITIQPKDGEPPIEYPLFKYGNACRIWSARMGDHDRGFEDNQHIYIQCVDNGYSVEKLIKVRFTELDVMCRYQAHENGTNHREIFYSTPEYTIDHLINEIHQICLPRQSISMKDKQISDLSTKLQLKNTHNANNKLVNKCKRINNELVSIHSKYNELNKIHKETRDELAETRAQLMQKTEECVIAQTEAKIYKQMTNNQSSAIQSDINTNASESSEVVEEEEEAEDSNATAPAEPTPNTHTVCVTCTYVIYLKHTQYLNI